MDHIREWLLPESRQSAEDRQLAYTAMHRIAEVLIEYGRSVVLDATYGPLPRRDELRSIAKRHSSPVLLIECFVTPELAVQRFESRPAGHPAVDLDSARVLESAGSFNYSHLGLVIDSALELAVMLASIDQYLFEGIPIRLDDWVQRPII